MTRPRIRPETLVFARTVFYVMAVASRDLVFCRSGTPIVVVSETSSIRNNALVFVRGELCYISVETFELVT